MAQITEKNQDRAVPIGPAWEYNLNYCSPGRQGIRVGFPDVM